MKVLLLGIRSLGDTVLASAVVHSIKHKFPSAEIDFLGDSRYISLFYHHPWVKKVYGVSRDEIAKKQSFSKKIMDFCNLTKKLRQRHYDIAIDLFSGPRSAILTYLSNAPLRVGEDKRKSIRGFLYNRRMKLPKGTIHVVEQLLCLAEAGLGKLKPMPTKLFVTEKEKKFATDFLKAIKIEENKKYKIGIFPGSGWKNKNWPPERFAQLANRLFKTGKAHIFIFGGKRERKEIKQIASLLEFSAHIISNLSLRELMALINTCNLWISNDTGPMHLAVALGVPVIALFGPQTPLRYGPWMPSKAKVFYKNLPCSPCPHHTDMCKDNICMKAIHVEEVFSGAINLLETCI